MLADFGSGSGWPESLPQPSVQGWGHLFLTCLVCRWTQDTRPNPHEFCMLPGPLRSREGAKLPGRLPEETASPSCWSLMTPAQGMEHGPLPVLGWGLFQLPKDLQNMTVDFLKFSFPFRRKGEDRDHQGGQCGYSAKNASPE